MDKIMTTVQNLQGDNNKLRSQLVVEESRTASAQKHSENLKSALETSSANNLVLENEVARWNAAYNALEQSHGTLKQDSIRMNNEHASLSAKLEATVQEKMQVEQDLAKRVVALARKVADMKRFYLARAEKLHVDPAELSLHDAAGDAVEEGAKHEEEEGAKPRSHASPPRAEQPGKAQLAAMAAEVESLRANLASMQSEYEEKVKAADKTYVAVKASSTAARGLWDLAVCSIVSCGRECFSAVKAAESSGFMLAAVQGCVAAVAEDQDAHPGVTLLERDGADPTLLSPWVPSSTADVLSAMEKAGDGEGGTPMEEGTGGRGARGGTHAASRVALDFTPPAVAGPTDGPGTGNPGDVSADGAMEEEGGEGGLTMPSLSPEV